MECCEQKGKTSIIMLVLVGVLLVFSLVQAYQIRAMGTVEGYATPSASYEAPSRSAPTMVGGC